MLDFSFVFSSFVLPLSVRVAVVLKKKEEKNKRRAFSLIGN